MVEELYHAAEIILDVILEVFGDGMTQVHASGPRSEWLATVTQPRVMSEPA